jgi:hypothetical protein
LEGFHIAGYTFERACRRLEKLLEGDGWKVGGRFTDVNQFLSNLRFDNLKASAESRKRIATRIKELQPKATNSQIARTLGVSDQTVRRDTSTNVESKKGKPKKNSGGGGGGSTNVEPVSGAKAAAIVERKETSDARRAELKQEKILPIVDCPNANERCELILSSLEDAKIAAESIDCILADPPYPEEVIPEWLKPGGLLVAMCGQKVKDIRDKAIAMAAYSLQAKDAELMAYSTEIKKRAVSRLGQLMDEKRKAGELSKGTKGSKIKGARVDEKPTLESQGVDKNLADAARKAAAMTEEKFEASVKKAVVVAVASIDGTQAMVSAARAERPKGCCNAGIRAAGRRSGFG